MNLLVFISFCVLISSYTMAENITIPRDRIIGIDGFIQSITCVMETREIFNCKPCYWFFGGIDRSVPLVRSGAFKRGGDALVCSMMNENIVPESCWFYVGYHSITDTIVSCIPPPDVAQSVFFISMSVLTVILVLYLIGLILLKVIIFLKEYMITALRIHLNSEVQRKSDASKEPSPTQHMSPNEHTKKKKVRFEHQNSPKKETENKKVRFETEKNKPE